MKAKVGESNALLVTEGNVIIRLPLTMTQQGQWAGSEQGDEPESDAGAFLLSD